MSIETYPEHTLEGVDSGSKLSILQRELRVIALHSSGKNEIRDQVLLMRNRLPFDKQGEKESAEDCALRVIKDQLDEKATSVAHVSIENGTCHAHVVEAPTGERFDLRRTFAARAFDLTALLQLADSARQPSLLDFDETDINLIREFQQKHFRQ